MPTQEILTDVTETTWTTPEGVSSLYIQCYGGGGGGAGYNSGTDVGGGGGGGGAYAATSGIPTTPGKEFIYIVSAGGTGGSQDSSGGYPTPAYTYFKEKYVTVSFSNHADVLFTHSADERETWKNTSFDNGTAISLFPGSNQIWVQINQGGLSSVWKNLDGTGESWVTEQDELNFGDIVPFLPLAVFTSQAGPGTTEGFNEEGGGTVASCWGDVKFAGGTGGDVTLDAGVTGGGGGGGAGSTEAGGDAGGSTAGLGGDAGGGMGGTGSSEALGSAGSNYGGGGGGGSETLPDGFDGGDGAIILEYEISLTQTLPYTIILSGSPANISDDRILNVNLENGQFVARKNNAKIVRVSEPSGYNSRGVVTAYNSFSATFGNENQRSTYLTSRNIKNQ